MNNNNSTADRWWAEGQEKLRAAAQARRDHDWALAAMHEKDGCALLRMSEQRERDDARRRQLIETGKVRECPVSGALIWL